MTRTTRRPYRGSRRNDHTCRNRGSCHGCRRNRLYNARRRQQAAEQEIAAWKAGTL